MVQGHHESQRNQLRLEAGESFTRQLSRTGEEWLRKQHRHSGLGEPGY